MRNFVLGGIVGAAAVGCAWWAASRSSRETLGVYTAARRTTRDDGVAQPPSPRTSPPRAQRPAVEPGDSASTDPPFPAGEALLRVGSGYAFGDSRAIGRGDLRGADIVCLDIRGEAATLRCPAGQALADLPLGAIGFPRSARDAAALAADAPEDLRPGDATISTTTAPRNPGIAFARSASGDTFKVWVLEIRGDSDALARAVRIGYAPVEARKGGGVIAATVAASARGAPTLRDLESVVAEGNAIPHASFANFLQGDYERPSSLPPELVLDERKYLLLDEPLATTVEFNRYSGLVAARGIAQSGKVRIRSYTGVDVRGEMAGEIDVGSYAYVHVSGDLTGRLDVHSYATVVIDGDLRGEVDISSYTTLLLRGRLLGKLSIHSGGSAFWFQQWMGRTQAEALEGRENELHLRESDLAAGKHEDVPGWETVTVAEEAWKLVAR